MATGLGLCSTDSDTNRQDSSPRPSIPIDRASFFNLLNLNGVHRPGSIYDAEIWAGSAEHVPQTNSLPHPWRRRRAGVSLKDGSVHWRRTCWRFETARGSTDGCIQFIEFRVMARNRKDFSGTQFGSLRNKVTYRKATIRWCNSK